MTHPHKVYNSTVFGIFRAVQPSPPSTLHLHHPRKKPCDRQQSLPNPGVGQTLIYFLFLQFCLFWVHHINGTVQHVAFCVWLLSLSIFVRVKELLFVFKSHIRVKVTWITCQALLVRGVRPTLARSPRSRKYRVKARFFVFFFWPQCALCGNLSSPARDRTWAPAVEAKS